MHILVIEDDRELNQQISDLLRTHDYRVTQSFDGEDGLLQAMNQSYHLILLDAMLPLRDGFSLLSILRKSSQVPVIMVTAKGAEEEKILGFSQGADDYVAKPFNSQELLLRIEALLRRSHNLAPQQQQQQVSLDELFLCHKTQQVKINDTELEFTPIQFKLLWELLLHKGQVLSKAYLYQKVLNRSLSAYDRSLDMHLSRVRKKLSQGNWQGERLQTCHGKGYCLQ